MDSVRDTRAPAVVIGAGFFGLSVALRLSESGRFDRVLVLDREGAAMQRASLTNQARVHGGYHYPRSLLTGHRSRVNQPRFLADFHDAIVDEWPHLYAIAARSSKVSARQFELFCARIGAEAVRDDAMVGKVFDRRLIDRAFRVIEPAFDSEKLRVLMLQRLEDSPMPVEIRYGTTVSSITSGGDRLSVITDAGEVEASAIYSAVYSGTNALFHSSGLPLIDLQHEVTEMPLVRADADGVLEQAITVMDGGYFSLMPFPTEAAFTFSHVRYTPQRRWRESNAPAGPVENPYRALEAHERASGFRLMKADATRYVPSLQHLEQVGSVWEVKTVLARSETDDSRPILFRPDHGLVGHTAILGAKLDNVYDVIDEVDAQLLKESL